MSDNPYAGMSDEWLVGAAREQARVIKSVELNDRRVREAPGPKGEASPEQSACINRMLLIRYVDELRRRGVDTDKILV